MSSPSEFHIRVNRFIREEEPPKGYLLCSCSQVLHIVVCAYSDLYCPYSHLLARRGMAQRIGNLLGRLQFSDDQLQKTQKGLKDAGVPMPNFGNVGRELAKEINEEPEPEPEPEPEESEDERMLLRFPT